MIFFLVSSATSLIYFVLFSYLSRPKPADFEAPEMLLVAAHSDDCVVMGAEIAWSILRLGGRVQVAYLTCSGPDPTSPIARTRAREARSAWARMGSEKVSFLQLNLSESLGLGPANYGPEELEVACSMLAQAITGLKDGAILLVPASHESHLDHRTTRDVALKAAEKAKRKGIQILETTEYNSVLSMRQDPVGVVYSILAQFPRVGSWLPRRLLAPGFRFGSPGASFQDTSERLEKKISMLSEFESQDSSLLLEYYAFPSRYRLFRNRRNWPVFGMLGGDADLTVVALVGLLALTAFFYGSWSSTMNWIGLGSVFTVAPLLLFALFKRRWVLASLSASLLLGFVAGGID